MEKRPTMQKTLSTNSQTRIHRNTSGDKTRPDRGEIYRALNGMCVHQSNADSSRPSLSIPSLPPNTPSSELEFSWPPIVGRPSSEPDEMDNVVVAALADVTR